MKTKDFIRPLVKVSPTLDFPLFLIQEELKTRKLFHILQKVGLAKCLYQPHLDKLVLSSIVLDDGMYETFEKYSIMLERIKKIRTDNNAVMKHALKPHQLMIEKRNRQTK